MRFKARLTSDKLGTFLGCVATCEKQGKQAVVLLSEDRIRFAVKQAECHGDDVLTFSDLSVNELFVEWRIESQNDNFILFELTLQNLLDALNSGKRAPACLLKLTKRDGKPCLSFETRACDIDVVHDLPVTLLRASEREYYLPPEVPQPQVQLELPGSKSLKNVIDRLKNMAKYVTLHGDMNGSLTARIDSDVMQCKTFFSDLRPRFESLDQNCANNKARLKVDTRKLATTLQCYALRHESIIMCMIEDYSLVVHVVLAPSAAGTVTFYLPVMNITGEEDMWEE